MFDLSARSPVKGESDVSCTPPAVRRPGRLLLVVSSIDTPASLAVLAISK